MARLPGGIIVTFANFHLGPIAKESWIPSVQPAYLYNSLCTRPRLVLRVSVTLATLLFQRENTVAPLPPGCRPSVDSR